MMLLAMGGFIGNIVAGMIGQALYDTYNLTMVTFKI